MNQLIAQGLSTGILEPTRKRGTPPSPLVPHLRVFTQTMRIYFAAVGRKLSGFAIALAIANLVLLSLSYGQVMQSQPKDESQIAVGYDQVRDIIRKRCVTCHNPDEMRGDLDLSTLPAILAGASSGPVVVAGKPNQSLLYKSAAHLDDPAMPPNSPKIPGRELALIRSWVEGGLTEKTGPSGEAQSKPQSKLQGEPKDGVTITSNDALTPHPLSDINATGMVSVRPVLRPTAIAALDSHPKQNIVAISGNQQAVLLDVSTGKWLGAFNFPEGDVTALRFSRDGKLLVVAGGVAGLSGRVVAFDLATGVRVFELADEKDAVLSVDLSPDGSMVALGGPAKVVRIYQVANGEVLHTLRTHTDWVLAVRFSPDGLLLASSDRFGGIFVWDPIRGTEFHALRGHVGSVHSIAWDRDSETLVSGGEDGRIRIWNLHHGELTGQWDSGVGAILSVDTDGSLITCGGRNKSVAIWSGPEQKVGSYVNSDQVERVSITADGNSLITANASGEISKIDPTSAAVQWSLNLPVDAAELKAVFKRMEEAASAYAIRRTEPPIESALEIAPVEDANVKGNASIRIDSALLDLNSELRASRENMVVLRENMAANSKLLAATDDAIKQLQQSQLALQSQLEKQKALLDAAEQHATAMESAIAKVISARSRLSNYVNPNETKLLKDKLVREQELLAASLRLLAQLGDSNDPEAVDADLRKTQNLVIALTEELRLRVKVTRSKLAGVEGKIESPDSLVDAEQ